MSIRVKVLGAIALTFLVIFVALFFVAQTVILSSYQELEETTTIRSVQRIQAVLQDSFDAMLATNRDWGWWDETYNYVRGEYPEYVEQNMSVTVIDNLNLNMMMFVDSNQEIIHTEFIDREAYEYVDVPEGLEAYFTPDSILMRHENRDSAVAGFVRIPNHLVMVSSTPVTLNEGAGEVAGALVLANFFDAPQVEQLAQDLQFDLEVLPYSAESLSADALAVRDSLSADTPIITEVLNEDTIAGYALISDIYGEPIGIIQANIQREIFQSGQETLRLFGLILAASGIAISIVTGLALEAAVIRRVTTLSDEVDEIQEVDAANRRVTVSSNDEVSNLSKNINTMLERIESNRKQLSQQNEALKVAYQQAEEATRLKSEFLSTMSHELRTPLNAIVGYSGIMLAGIGGEIDGDARGMIENISESSEHLLKLINDILDISKIEAGRMEIVAENFAVRPMVETVKNNLQVLAEQKKLEFDVNVGDDVPMLLVGDKERITQILINLLSNAFKFTEKGAVGLYVNWEGDELSLRVRDTGIGIPAHAINLIFEEFRQVDGTSSRAYQGTGLGLAIVKKLAEAMGGTVTVESKLGEGSVFTVSLPLKPALQTVNSGE